MERYLKLSLERLKEWTGLEPEEMKHYYDTCLIDMYAVEEGTDGLVYCTFAWPLLNIDGEKYDFKQRSMPAAEEIVTLVYDGDTIVADIAALHCTLLQLLYMDSLLTYCENESDWMYLEGQIVREIIEGTVNECEVMLYASAYVTKIYRQKGIFKTMLQIMTDFSTRGCCDHANLTEIFSLDPDIACYGPDKRDEPYYYSYEKDEPDRIRNRSILEKYKFVPIRLEEDILNPDSDGTKTSFAVRKQIIKIVLYDEEGIS